jgi:hypothetical protein
MGEMEKQEMKKQIERLTFELSEAESNGQTENLELRKTMEKLLSEKGRLLQ